MCSMLFLSHSQRSISHLIWDFFFLLFWWQKKKNKISNLKKKQNNDTHQWIAQWPVFGARFSVFSSYVHSGGLFWTAIVAQRPEQRITTWCDILFSVCAQFVRCLVLLFFSCCHLIPRSNWCSGPASAIEWIEMRDWMTDWLTGSAALYFRWIHFFG